MAKVERLWADCPSEERRMVREWSLAQTGLVRALRNGDISVTDYLLIRWRAWNILKAIKEKYESDSNY